MQNHKNSCKNHQNINRNINLRCKPIDSAVRLAFPLKLPRQYEHIAGEGKTCCEWQLKSFLIEIKSEFVQKSRRARDDAAACKSGEFIIRFHLAQ